MSVLLELTGVMVGVISRQVTKEQASVFTHSSGSRSTRLAKSMQWEPVDHLAGFGLCVLRTPLCRQHSDGLVYQICLGLFFFLHLWVSCLWRKPCFPTVTPKHNMQFLLCLSHFSTSTVFKGSLFLFNLHNSHTYFHFIRQALMNRSQITVLCRL